MKTDYCNCELICMKCNRFADELFNYDMCYKCQNEEVERDGDRNTQTTTK